MPTILSASRIPRFGSLLQGIMHASIAPRKFPRCMKLLPVELRVATHWQAVRVDDVAGSRLEVRMDLPLHPNDLRKDGLHHPSPEHGLEQTVHVGPGRATLEICRLTQAHLKRATLCHSFKHAPTPRTGPYCLLASS
jgi:hypothetical protein